MSAHVLQRKAYGSGDIARPADQNQVSTISADSFELYDALAPRRDRHTVVLAPAVSVVVHAAAITFLPGMRTPQPRTDVITVELEHKLPPAETPKRTPPRKPVAKQQRIEKPFERQELQAIPTPTVVPKPEQVDPREDVALAPRPEPTIERRPQTPEPVSAQSVPLVSRACPLLGAPVPGRNRGLEASAPAPWLVTRSHRRLLRPDRDA